MFNEIRLTIYREEACYVKGLIDFFITYEIYKIVVIWDHPNTNTISNDVENHAENIYRFSFSATFRACELDIKSVSYC